MKFAPHSLQEKIRGSNRRMEQMSRSRDYHMKQFVIKNFELIAKFWEEKHQTMESSYWQRLMAELEGDSETKRTGLTSSPVDIQGRQPSFINGVMRDYQIEGLQWLLDLDASHAAG